MRLSDVTQIAMTLGAILASTTLFAQKWYVKPSLGSSLPLINVQFLQVDDNIDPTITTTNTIDGTSSIKSAEGNLAQGLRFNLSAGKYCNENFGVEIGIDYLKGKKQTLANHTINTVVGDALVDLTSDIWSIAITPSIVIQGNGETFKPYARVGLYVPLGGSMKVNADISDPGTGVITKAPGVNYTLKSTLEISSNFTLGYLGALGAKYQLNEKISLFGEVQVIDFNSIGKDAKMTSFTETTNGNEKGLEDLTTYEKNRVYITEITETSNTHNSANPDQNKAMEELATYMNLSSVSLNFGVFIRL